MAAAILPALRVAGPTAMKQLPGLVSAVKEQIPAAYDKVTSYFGKSNKTPEAVTNAAVARGDKFMSQAILETLMRSGVSAEFISSAAPLFTVQELKSLQIAFSDLDKAERGVADSRSATLNGDADTIFAHDNVQIVRLCKNLSISSDSLADLVSFVATRGPAQIHRYQAFEKANGRRPI